MLEHERQQLQDTRIAPGAVVLADLTRATFPDTTDLNACDILELHGRPDNKTRLSKCALLVSEEAFSRADTVSSQSGRSSNFSVIVFTSIHIACTWLGLDVSEALAHLGSPAFDSSVPPEPS